VTLTQEADRRGLKMTDIVRLLIRKLPKNKNKEIVTNGSSTNAEASGSLFTPGCVSSIHINSPGLNVCGYVADTETQYIIRGIKQKVGDVFEFN
jgi:hypothetical protein